MDKVIGVEKKHETDRLIIRVVYERSPAVIVEALGTFDRGFREIRVINAQTGFVGSIRASDADELKALTELVFALSDMASAIRPPVGLEV